MYKEEAHSLIEETIEERRRESLNSYTEPRHSGGAKKLMKLNVDTIQEEDEITEITPNMRY